MLVLIKRVALHDTWCQAGEQTTPAWPQPPRPKVKATDAQRWQSGDSMREAHLAHVRHCHPQRVSLDTARCCADAACAGDALLTHQSLGWHVGLRLSLFAVLFLGSLAAPPLKNE